MMHATNLSKKNTLFARSALLFRHGSILLDMHACAPRQLDPRLHACFLAWFVAACRAVHGCGKGMAQCMHACMLSPASSSYRDAADRPRGTYVYVCGTGAGRHGAHTT
jgi:hypothetical protein